MVPRTNGNTKTVEQHTHIVMMYVAYQKRNNTVLMFGTSEDTHAFYFIEPIGSIAKQFIFMRRDLGKSDGLYIPQRLGQRRAADVIRSAGLKLIRQFIERRVLERHILNHLPTSLIRRQAV